MAVEPSLKVAMNSGGVGVYEENGSLGSVSVVSSAGDTQQGANRHGILRLQFFPLKKED